MGGHPKTANGLSASGLIRNNSPFWKFECEGEELGENITTYIVFHPIFHPENRK
jgi:hypothetical protein